MIDTRQSTYQLPNSRFNEGDSFVAPDSDVAQPATDAATAPLNGLEDFNKFKEEVRSDATRLALTVAALTRETPLYIETARDILERELLETTPEIRELNEISQRLSAAQEASIERIMNDPARRTAMLGIRGMTLGESEKREKIRARLINHEMQAAKSLVPAISEELQSRLCHRQGGWFWMLVREEQRTIGLRKATTDVVVSTIYYSAVQQPGQEAAFTKTQTWHGYPGYELRESVSGDEIERLLDLARRYERIAHENVHLPNRGR